MGPESGRLMVVAREEPVGFVCWLKVSHGPPPSSCWNVGIGLLPDHRNRGIGTAAQRLLVDYLFSVTDAVRVEAGSLTDNLGEQRSLEKAGFHREGVLRSAQYLDGRWRDVILFSRLRSD
jgi:RimJ/RimL family protein N-acetyltransferase